MTVTGRGAGRVLGMASTEDVARDGGDAPVRGGNVVAPVDRDAVSYTHLTLPTILRV